MAGPGGYPLNARDQRALSYSTPRQRSQPAAAISGSRGPAGDAELHQGRGFSILDPDNPMGTIRGIARQLAEVTAQLRAYGYFVPDVDYTADPVGFLSINAAFLAKVEPGLVTAMPLDGVLQ